MTRKSTLTAVAGVVVSFVALAGTILYLLAARKIIFEVAMLMLVALFGMYLGFGVLFLVYRLISKLD